MRIRDWQDIVRDVVDEDVDPDGWRAIAGNRTRGLGEDMYLAHPRSGVYLLKTYAKNPFDVKGVGSHVARKVDDDIDPYLPDGTGSRFAVNAAPTDEEAASERAKRLEETIRAHADAPTTPDALFEDVMLAIESPAFGPIEYEFHGRPDPLDGLSSTFEEAEELLDSELDDLIDTDEVDRGFM